MPVVVLVADGARPDVLQRAINTGELPAIAQLRSEGGAFTVTSVFPSVTGPAYAPFLMGRFPGPVGLPGIRWFDRERTATSFPHYSRSYVGLEMRHVDRDISAAAPTIFELVPDSLGSLFMIGRGLASHRRLGRGFAFMMRAGTTHFRGNVSGWVDIDREISERLVRRIARDRPEFVFASFLGVDKTSHSEGQSSPAIRDALRIIDDTAARIRSDAERRGSWHETHLWIVSDHGHVDVAHHEDLAGLVARWGFRTLAHPWIYSLRPADVAVMVSGNAMAHLYLDLRRRERPWWPALNERYGTLVANLLERPSVDLMILPRAPNLCEIRAKGRGAAQLSAKDGRFSYRPMSGDPLALGALDSLTADEAYAATIDSDYPDALVQLSHLTGSARCGDIVLSATREWDFRSRYEPIPHRSSHGALHRDHMLVPLVLNRQPTRLPQRTVDVMPSALAALGKSIPSNVDGTSFV